MGIETVNVEPICDKCKTYIIGRTYVIKHRVPQGLEFYVLCESCYNHISKLAKKKK